MGLRVKSRRSRTSVEEPTRDKEKNSETIVRGLLTKLGRSIDRRHFVVDRIDPYEVIIKYNDEKILIVFFAGKDVIFYLPKADAGIIVPLSITKIFVETLSTKVDEEFESQIVDVKRKKKVGE